MSAVTGKIKKSKLKSGSLKVCTEGKSLQIADKKTKILQHFAKKNSLALVGKTERVFTFMRILTKFLAAIYINARKTQAEKKT